MTIQGDLSTLQLADLLQSIENGERSGVLSIDGPDGPRQLWFDAGKLALFASEDRPALVEMLVACGAVREKDLEAARKKRRGSGRSLGEILVEARRIDADELRSIAEARLLDEACELVAARNESFRFEEGPPPRGVFDAEERRLKLRLAAGPLLLESARREDHWRMIRSRVPSDSAHYRVARAPAPPVDGERQELASALLERLDGTLSVSETMARFPHQRFEAYRLLAELAESGVVRMARSEDMVRLVRERAKREPERAWKLLERGLAHAPQDRELLIERALLGETLGQLEEAAEALKVLAHLHLESGENELGRERLQAAKRVAPGDPAVWEKSLRLALAEGRHADALVDGRSLVELYRSPGLHQKACQVLAELVRIRPASFELRLELARSQADSGSSSAAVDGLLDFARRALSSRSYARAKQAFQEVLRFDASHEVARAAIARIDAGEYERRRLRRQRLLRLTCALVFAAICSTVALREAAARRGLARAERDIARGEWIETKSYERAVEALEEVGRAHPWTSTALFDVPRRVEELEAKAHSGDGSESQRRSASSSGASGTSDR